ncbi:hypothetical protein [Scytonema hofmannii]|nr:hypothetical protein [Scytonema hofmannii]
MNYTVGRGARPCAPTAVVYLPENGCNAEFCDRMAAPPYPAYRDR